MELKDVVAISSIRTPIGKFGGTLKDIYAYDLGAMTIREALKRIDLDPKEVDEVILGHCRQAGNGPNPARTASVRGGIPVTVPVQTINMACPSAMMAVALASNSILLGRAKVVVAGGMESMSTMPYLLKDVRWNGFKLGNRILLDGWADTIDPLCNMGMGETAENLAVKYNISRIEQDEYALISHRRAAKARDEGLFDFETFPIHITRRKEEAIEFARDEGIRLDTNMEKLSKLKPVFKSDGTITAGNACQMGDGAVVIVLTSREHAKELNATPLFSIVSWRQAAVDPAFMGEGPAIVIPLALADAGLNMNDIDLFEVNEAFAVQMLANERVLKWDREKVNIFGGGIALGHPTGITGARILVTLHNALRQRKKEVGVASLCGGGGVTMAMVIRVE